MPTIVKERVQAKPAESSTARGLGMIALVLGIAIAATLLASLASPSASTETDLDMSYFAP
jgi:hypothetical protein